MYTNVFFSNSRVGLLDSFIILTNLLCLKIIISGGLNHVKHQHHTLKTLLY